MTKPRISLADVIGEFAAELFGWIASSVTLGSLYFAGAWAAPHFGLEKSTLGIISALGFMWSYQRWDLDRKTDRIIEVIGNHHSD